MGRVGVGVVRSVGTFGVGLALALLAGAVPAWAAIGDDNGTFTTTTSTTHHDTHTRVDLEPLHDHLTRVTAVLGGQLVFDESTAAAPGSAEVAALVAQGRAALREHGAASVSGPTTVSSTQTTGAPVLQSTVQTGVETSVTTQTTFGPGTILIGPDQSQTFFVADGTTNVNTNTHTETFFDDRFQATVHHRYHLQVTGTVEADPDVAPDVVAIGPVAAAPTATG